MENEKNNKTWNFSLVICGFCIFFLFLINRPINDYSPTHEQFKKIKNGMTYKETCKIIGKKGEEVSRGKIAGYETVIYQWSGGFGAMNATFQNNKLVIKSQFGLK